jgi:hypothetical protein
MDYKSGKGLHDYDTGQQTKELKPGKERSF